MFLGFLFTTFYDDHLLRKSHDEIEQFLSLDIQDCFPELSSSLCGISLFVLYENIMRHDLVVRGFLEQGNIIRVVQTVPYVSDIFGDGSLDMVYSNIIESVEISVNGIFGIVGEIVVAASQEQDDSVGIGSHERVAAQFGESHDFEIS